jgi:hypothetical protein
VPLKLIRLARAAAEALKTPDEWKATSGRAWFEHELAAAAEQRVVHPGGAGPMHSDAERLGAFREARARRFWALPAVEMAGLVGEALLALRDALASGFAVSAIAFDAYNAQSARVRRQFRFKLPEGYARRGDFYVPPGAPPSRRAKRGLA